MPHSLVIVLSFILTAVLLAAFFVFTEVDFQRIWLVAIKIDPIYLAGILFSTLLNWTIAAYKWRLTLSSSTHNKTPGSFGFCFFYSSLGVMFGQLMPAQVSTTLARSIGTKIHGRISLFKGAVTSFYEQIFDIMVPVILVIPSVIAVIYKISFLEWLLLAMTFLGLAGLMISQFRHFKLLFLKGVIVWIIERIPWLNKKVESLMNSGLIDKKLILQLFFLSILKYTNLIFRIVLIIIGCSLSVSWINVIYVRPLIYLSTLISRTPAGIGISEWTYVGLLVAVGEVINDAVEFALVARIVIFSSIFLTAIPVICLYLYLFFRKRTERFE